MQADNYIKVLINVYEKAYSEYVGNILPKELRKDTFILAIQAANAVALSGWHGQGDRAASIAAELLRAVFAETAFLEAEELTANVRLRIAFDDKPPTREQIEAGVS